MSDNVVKVPAADDLDALREASKQRYEIMTSGAFADRSQIIAIFATLPDEAFGYCAVMLSQVAQERGGFKTESKAALAALEQAYQAWFTTKESQR